MRNKIYASYSDVFISESCQSVLLLSSAWWWWKARDEDECSGERERKRERSVSEAWQGKTKGLWWVSLWKSALALTHAAEWMLMRWVRYRESIQTAPELKLPRFCVGFGRTSHRRCGLVLNWRTTGISLDLRRYERTQALLSGFIWNVLHKRTQREKSEGRWLLGWLRD